MGPLYLRQLCNLDAPLASIFGDFGKPLNLLSTRKFNEYGGND